MNGLMAVILGGGTGSRLFPLTLHRSKPAVPIVGKYRLIDIPISNCINSDISRIFVLTQYNSAGLNRHIARTYQFDRFRRGFVTVLAAEQTPESSEWFQGTADAVRRNLAHLNTYRSRDVLILAGDQLYLMDYRPMLELHRRTEAEVTIGVVPVAREQASAFGIVRMDALNRVSEFNEKPSYDALSGLESPVPPGTYKPDRVYLASMGIYIFRRDILQRLLDDCPDEHDFAHDLIPRAVERRHVVGYPYTGYWSDIGTIRSFYEAHLLLARKGPEFNVYNPDMPIFSNARMLPPAKIQSSYIQDSIIGEGSVVVNSHISNSVIGIRSFIGENTTIKNSILIGSSYYPWQGHASEERIEGPDHPGIGEESYIEGTIVDRNASVGRRCIISNRDHVWEGEGPGFYIREGLIVIPKNNIIEDFTII